MKNTYYIEYILPHTHGIDATLVLPFVPLDIEDVVENSTTSLVFKYFIYTHSFHTIKQLSARKSDITLFDFEAKEMLGKSLFRNISIEEVKKTDPNI